MVKWIRVKIHFRLPVFNTNNSVENEPSWIIQYLWGETIISSHPDTRNGWYTHAFPIQNKTKNFPYVFRIKWHLIWRFHTTINNVKWHITVLKWSVGFLIRFALQYFCSQFRCTKSKIVRDIKKYQTFSGRRSFSITREYCVESRIFSLKYINVNKNKKKKMYTNYCKNVIFQRDKKTFERENRYSFFFFDVYYK